jgi:hypothetical protein
MEKRQRVQSSSYIPNRLQNRLLLGLIALVVMASLAAPARAQYQYAQQAPMMAVSAASGLFRAVPMMATGLVRLVPHPGHKNKNKNKNNNNVANGNMQQGQGYPGFNGQQAGNMSPLQANGAPNARNGYSNTPQDFQNAQAQYNNSTGLNVQNGQNSYNTVQGQMYNAPGQTGYGMQGSGMQGASSVYGPRSAQ